MRRARRLASAAAPWTLPAFAVTTVLLGLWGWLDYGYRFDNALYRAVALFSINNEIYRQAPGSADLRFLIGRWTGLLSVFGAALFALAALLREQAVVALARLVRRRVVIIGAGDIALKAFERARVGGLSSVWIGAPSLDAHRLSAFALPWPAEDLERTVQAGVADAEQILVAQDDPASSLVLAKVVRAAAPRARITVVLNDASLAEDAAAMINEPNTRVISAATVAARALHLSHPPFLRAREVGHARIHALIVGFGQAGQAIARDLIVNGRTTYLAIPRITVIDPGARALEGAIRVRAPELDHCAEMVFIEGRVGTRGVEPGVDLLVRTIAAGGPVTAVYVCRSADADNLGAAGILQSLLRISDLGEPAIFTRLRDAHTLTQSRSGGRGLDALIPFGDIGAIVAASEFLSEAPDAAARAFSEAYRSMLPEARRNDPANRSGRPWDELDETFRQATRDAVAHIPAKLASAGIDPALWRGRAGPPRIPRELQLFRTAAEREALAALEHERWNVQRRLDGWRWADVPAKDELRRLHPALVPYDQLSDEVKGYDRALVDETQAICWAARDI
ncbi:MAG: hypothetical protein KKE02_05245 [Alphaproteobacteria bacterium]|nr:hypothetical protein [Alphaproteobacteria bacterium]MBU1514596.1 hypothetical protein [Alphaproteobacteria bacterium]MBU2096772.1 hypothetical protein [Alphaproteobacteria bacterium]MBU2150404.1 hypothetical protein [Alphaproteobacteria bacterium]MBU2306595.1 hypothetical protein [Alphaproteobacteria bacterium]